MKKISFLFLFLSFLNQAFAFTISGKITDEKNEPIPFANIYIKGTTRGTTSNMQGVYAIDLAPGKYELAFKMIGYKLHIEDLNITDAPQIINVKLAAENFDLKEVVIKADGEDPAYAIIRQAQKKRKYYLEQVEAYSCDVYIKGVQRILKAPKKILGMEIDPDNERDTTTGIVYLSESVSKFNFKQKNNIKEEMISSKVSGDNKAFSYNQASDMLFNFYENILEVGGLSERGFISPIANTAMVSYRYKLLGTFYEDGQMIHKIQVIPKRKNDPVFSGIINITENTWRIHSLQLILTKDAQIDFVDTLRINQVFLPVEKDIWLPFSTKFTFDFGVLGIKGDGMFVGVNSNYVIDPDFPKHFFSNETMKVNEDANKKDSAYWDVSRPVPLTIEEANDYRRRDSMNLIKHSKVYTDSTDKMKNKLKFKDLFVGYNHINTFKKQYWSIAGPLLGTQFNTVQGCNLSTSFNFTKAYENNKRYNIGCNVGYGFSNKDMYGSVFGFYYYKPQKFAKFSAQAGKEYVQFNENRPIFPLINSLYTLLNEENFMKLYLKNYASISHSSELFNGFYFFPTVEYAERISLKNSTDFRLVKSDYNYSSNDPQNPDSLGYSFENNQALTLDIKLKYVFKQRYFTGPNLKYVTGSKFPTLRLNYKKGIYALGSKVNYDLLTCGIEGTLNLKRFGNSSYSIIAGSFLNTRKMYFMDWYHFNGNQTLFSSFEMNSFQLLDYYSASTKSQFLEGHFQHNFGGFFLSKIPLIKKLKLVEIGKVSVLTTDGKNTYAELSIGVQRLNFRACFASGFSNQNQISSGVRVGMEF
ncbi:MAG: DUF5686 and carboxypeptidase regulatory-like domain-containing protein [Bacteroidetes bacterium]|nr:DUF5686 and carboxypeptidase regulatory-like domain-containing protein [Bacteroidota bacterium]